VIFDASNGPDDEAGRIREKWLDDKRV